MFALPVWARVIGCVVFGVLLLFFVNPILLGIRNSGVFTGIVLCLLGLFYFGANSFAASWMEKLWMTSNFGRFIMCLIFGILGLGMLLAIVFSICMGAAMADKPKEENPVVILGCKVRGEQPSLMLKKRLDAALPYLKEHPDVQVIVCGGQGKDEGISEAACMTAYLTKNGIEADRISEDNTSTSTYENLANARHILETNEWGYDIILVTDGFHQFRAGTIAKSLRLESDKISAPTPWYLVPSYWVREWLGICHMYIFG